MTASDAAPPPKDTDPATTPAMDEQSTETPEILLDNTGYAASDTLSGVSEDDYEQEARSGAQPPEPKVTITSPSPDVVIATLETPDPNAAAQAETEDISSTEDTDSRTIQDNSDQDSSDTIDKQEPTTTAHHTDDANNSHSVPVDESLNDSSAAAQPASTTNTDIAGTTDTHTDVSHATNPPAASEATHTEAGLKSSTTPATDSGDDIPAEVISADPNTQEGSIDPEDAVSAEAEKEAAEQEKKEAKLEAYKQFVAEQFSDKKIDYPEVRVTIEANALPSKMYFVMNTLSAIIASYGLVTNSAAVVIGAMLVAMMLGPITGVALAIIDYRMPLLRKSLLTVAAGVSLVIVVGFVVGLLHQGQPLTSEILSRTQPTSMDLMIALAGGTAGAYAMVSPHLSVAVVGVAVATALVPPLAASGILFANGELQMGLGALLLAITNIIAIQFTNAMVLWFLGFRRLVDDDYKSGTYLTFLRRNAVTLCLLVGLGIYLTLNLNSNAKQQAFENQVKEAINAHFKDQGNVLTNTQFDKNNGFQIIRAVIRGETSPNSQDVQEIENVITKEMTERFPKYPPIKLQLRYLPVQVIESDPLIKDKLDETDAAILTN